MALDYVSLGNLRLNRNLRLRGAIGNNAVISQISRPAEGDGINIMQWRTGTPARHPGRKLVLDGSGSGLGRLSVGDIRSIEALQSLGQPVMLEHHAWSGMVLISAIHISGGVTPDYADYDNAKRVAAEIELIEV